MPKVQIDITAKDDATSVLNKVTRALGDTSKQQEGLTGAIFKGNALYGLAEKGLGALANGLQSVTVGSLKTYAAYEQTAVALNTMLGSQEKATQLIGEMQSAAAKSPFSFSDYATAGKQLIAFGVGAESVVSTMNKLGDVASGLSQPIGDIVYLYGQIKTQGRAMSQDLMQFSMRGIPIYEELGKVMGKPTSAIKNMASQGKITFKEIDAVFNNLTQSGGKFAGLMQAQSMTLSGKWSNLNDQFEQTQVLLGAKMAPAAGDVVTMFSLLLEKMNDSIAAAAELEKKNPTESYKSGIAQVNSYLDGTIAALDKMNMGIAPEQVGALREEIYMISEGWGDASQMIDGMNQRYGKVATAIQVIRAHEQGFITAKKEQLELMRKIVAEEQARQNITKETPGVKTEEAPKEKKYSEADKKAWASARSNMLKYYKDLEDKRELDSATAEEQIEIRLKREQDKIEEYRKKWLLKDGEYELFRMQVEQQADEERYKLKYNNQAKLFDDLAAIETQFYAETGNVGADAIGEMMNNITSELKNLSKVFSDTFKDIAQNSKQTGMTFGDSFKLGAAVASTALSSVAAIIQMQYALVKQGYDAQLEALDERMQAELDAYDQSLENQVSYEEEKDALRQLELEAYAESLAGKTDKEIDYALAKKRLELKEASDSAKIKEKEEAEKDAINKKYEMEKYGVEVEAFNAQQDYQKSMVKIQTAIGVVNAWSSAMALPFPFNIAAAGTLTALMVGTAAKQLQMIDSQKPPAPPAFASGITNFEGGLALVGERGRELVNLPKGSNVITNENTESLLNSGVRYVINNIYLDSRLVKQDIVDTRRASAYGGY